MRIPKSRRGETILQGNLVSFTDIAFSVVLFFMVAATFAKSNAMKVELPGSESGAVDQTQETITVQADANSIALDGAPVALLDLSDAIGAKLVGRTKLEEKVIVLMTAEDITFQRNVELMHAIRRAGGEVAIMYEEQVK